jgi:hypothetical protein
MNRTLFVIVVVVFAVLSSACVYEVRNGNEVWVCDDQVGSPSYGFCGDTGMRVGS